jgi:hypothetical protein
MESWTGVNDAGSFYSYAATRNRTWLAIAVFDTVNAYNDVSSMNGRRKTGEYLNNSCKRRVE